MTREQVRTLIHQRLPGVLEIVEGVAHEFGVPAWSAGTLTPEQYVTILKDRANRLEKMARGPSAGDRAERDETAHRAYEHREVADDILDQLREPEDQTHVEPEETGRGATAGGE